MRKGLYERLLSANSLDGVVVTAVCSPLLPPLGFVQVCAFALMKGAQNAFVLLRLLDALQFALATYIARAVGSWGFALPRMGSSFGAGVARRRGIIHDVEAPLLVLET